MAHVAVLLADDFEDSEFKKPHATMLESGHRVDVIGTEATPSPSTIASDRGRAVLPKPRGPRSAEVIGLLTKQSKQGAGLLPSASLDHSRHESHSSAVTVDDEDLHVALYCLYELHHRGFVGVDDALEWDPTLLAIRRYLEKLFEHALLREVPLPDAGDPVQGFAELTKFGGPSLSSHMAEEGTLHELREFAIHRSIYQLKEADPHTWAIPRFSGPSRAALVEIQFDEYGEGIPGRSHAELFAQTMDYLELDPTYGAYLDSVPGITLATVNLVEFFGLHRRLLPALVGHLAHFEMNSVVPMARYATACRRLGLPDAAAEFYDVHVVADEHHAVLARDQLVGCFPDRSPDARSLIVWGAATLSHLEDRLTQHLLHSWQSGQSSLRNRRRAGARPTLALDGHHLSRRPSIGEPF